MGKLRRKSKPIVSSLPPGSLSPPILFWVSTGRFWSMRWFVAEGTLWFVGLPISAHNLGTSECNYQLSTDTGMEHDCMRLFSQLPGK